MKKRNTLLIILFSILFLSTKAQVLHTIANNKLIDYIVYEKQIASQKFGGQAYTDLDLSLKYKMAKPILFLRKYHSSGIKLSVLYLFSIPDSTVRKINIEIDTTMYINCVDTNSNCLDTSNSFFHVVKSAYDQFKDEMDKRIGAPIKSEPLEKRREWGETDFYQMDSWESDIENARIYLHYFTKNNKATYRVRLNLTFKE